MSIMFGGDFYIKSGLNFDKIASDGVKEFISTPTHVVLNLEAAITTSENKSYKTGPCLKIHPFDFDNFNGNNISFVLANNHILDFGDIGAEDTLRKLDSRGLNHAGLLRTSNPIDGSMILLDDNKKIAIYNICENEWSSISIGNIFANGFDEIKCFNDIRSLKENADHVIVVFHGGDEFRNVPSPLMKKRLRFLVDVGADAVISHHTHRISGYEVYNKKPIFYGLGNFYFPYKFFDSDWCHGMTVTFDFSGGDINFQLNFVVFSGDGSSFNLVSSEREHMLLSSLDKINSRICDDEYLSENWLEYSRSIFNSNINFILVPRLFNRILSRILPGRKLYKNSVLLRLLNFIRCESHRDIIEAGIKEIVVKQSGR